MIYDFNPAESEILIGLIVSRLRDEIDKARSTVDTVNFMLDNGFENSDYPASNYVYLITLQKRQIARGDAEEIIDLGNKIFPKVACPGSDTFYKLRTQALNYLNQIDDLAEKISGIVEKKRLTFNK